MRTASVTFMTVFISVCTGKVADGQYGKIPAVFYNDNYDQCMLRGNEALFCSITYELSPSDPSNTTEIWQTIHQLSSNQENYRHDLLRHGICVPETCPNIDPTGELSKEINRCYDDKFREKYLKGRVTEIKCETNKSPYPIDWLDIVVGLFFVAYFSFVLYATSRDVWWDDLGEKQDKTSTNQRILSTFSLWKNWNRIMITKDIETNQWKAIQGVRFYNQLIVIFSHTILFTFSGPVANTKFTEGVSDKFLTLFIISGPLAVSTNFCLATFFLTYGLYAQLEGKKFKFTAVLIIFFSRIMRLLPACAVIVLFVMTWIRHLGSGPYWNLFIMDEYKFGQKNGWSNLLFLNNIINPEAMCNIHTWYLAQDTQNFLIALVLIWLFKKYHKLMFPTLMAMIVFCMGIVFFENYMADYDSLVFPNPELCYHMKYMRSNPHWIVHLLNFYGNLIPSLLGILFGYGYYLNKKTSFLQKYDEYISKYFHLFLYGPGLLITLLPGILALQIGMAHSAFWASSYNAVARLIFTISVSGSVILCTLGYGGLTKKVLEWAPTFIMGRLSYSAYLIHYIFMLIRSSLIRFPVHLSEYDIMTTYLSDAAISYLGALGFALLFELPISQLQKIIFPLGDPNKTKTSVPRSNEKKSDRMKLNGLKKE